LFATDKILESVGDRKKYEGKHEKIEARNHSVVVVERKKKSRNRRKEKNSKQNIKIKRRTVRERRNREEILKKT
jgi:hypothetical protein